MNAETKKISLSIKELNPIDPVGAKKEEGLSATEEEELPKEHVEDMTNTIGESVKG